MVDLPRKLIIVLVGGLILGGDRRIRLQLGHFHRNPYAGPTSSVGTLAFGTPLGTKQR